MEDISSAAYTAIGPIEDTDKDAIIKATSAVEINNAKDLDRILFSTLIYYTFYEFIS